MNEETQLMTLYDYVQSKGMTMEDFSRLTDISATYLYKIQKDRNANLSVEMIRKIYHATLAKYGVGLEVWEYLNKSVTTNE